MCKYILGLECLIEVNVKKRDKISDSKMNLFIVRHRFFPLSNVNIFSINGEKMLFCLSMVSLSLSLGVPTSHVLCLT